MKFKYFAIVVNLLGMLVSPFTESFAAYNRPDPRVDTRSTQEIAQDLARDMKIDHSRLRQKWKNYKEEDLKRMAIFMTQDELYADKWSWYRTIYEGTKDGLKSIGIAIDDFVDETQIKSLYSTNNAKERSIRDDLMYGHNMVKNLRENELEERLEERLEYKELYNAFHDIGQFLFFAIILGVLVGIPLLIKAKSKRKKVKTISRKQRAKITNNKIEIVNNQAYVSLKKLDRIKYLQDLKKQATTRLGKARKELESEQNKLKDVPADVAKYIKPKDTSTLKASISKLEYKLMAIDELLSAETGKTKQQKKSSSKNYIDDEEL
jgi:hypothetical protein